MSDNDKAPSFSMQSMVDDWIQKARYVAGFDQVKKEFETYEEVIGQTKRIKTPTTFDELAYDTEKDRRIMSFVATSIAHEHMLYMDTRVNEMRRIKIMNAAFDGKYVWVAMAYEKPNGIGLTLARLCAVK